MHQALDGGGGSGGGSGGGDGGGNPLFHHKAHKALRVALQPLLGELSGHLFRGMGWQIMLAMAIQLETWGSMRIQTACR